jgi:hypothetical protein
MLGAPVNIKVAPHDEGEEIIIDLDEEEWVGAVISPADEDSHIHVELYDSGTTRHISPYRSDFSSYSPLIPPIFLNTANQQCFPAIGTGMLVIRVPNGGTESELTLHGVLHAPAVGCTLVSVTALDEKGYHVHIGAGHLELTSKGSASDASLEPRDAFTRSSTCWMPPMLLSQCRSWSCTDASTTSHQKAHATLSRVVL